jgi:hypothetical protein
MDKGEDSTKDTKEEEVNKVQKKKRTQFKTRGAPRTFNLRQILPVEQRNAIVVAEVDIMGRNAK